MNAGIETQREAPQVRIRAGSAADIDTLLEIDLDASELFVRAGLDMDLPDDHEFAVTERTRWLRSLESGRTLLAVDASGAPLGFAASGTRDQEPFIEQLSVRRHAMGMGIGTALLSAAEREAVQQGASTLWLTTYGHLSWNRPFYERRGFIVVKEEHCGHEIRAELAFERRWLPSPQERVVMRKRLSEGGLSAWPWRNR